MRTCRSVIKYWMISSKEGLILETHLKSSFYDRKRVQDETNPDPGDRTREQVPLRRYLGKDGTVPRSLNVISTRKIRGVRHCGT